MKMSVIIPTYRRPDNLSACLRGLSRQTRAADQILVVVRDGDEATSALLEREFPGLTRVNVNQPGQVYALNKGLECADADIVCITDDDTIPRNDWLENIHAHFEADPIVGGVGGRDWIHRPDGSIIDGAASNVGKLHWNGTHVGNHHLGVGPPRPVDILKGANMSFRSTAIGDARFSAYLLGAGAQVGNDMDFSLAIRRAGWKLIYDPAVAIDHFPAARTAGDDRAFEPIQCFQTGYNETMILLQNLSHSRQIAFWIWAILLGNCQLPGIIQVPRLWLKREVNVVGRWWAATRGRYAALRARYAAAIAPCAAVSPHQRTTSRPASLASGSPRASETNAGSLQL